MKMNIKNMVWATERSKRYISNILDLAMMLKIDHNKKERLNANQCVWCFYGSRIGGAAMSHNKCMSCNKEEMYSSTDTDVLCLPCAKEHKLCKHCGADLELRVGRRNWSEVK